MTASYRSRRRSDDAGPRRTVLIADDDPHSRAALERNLGRHFDVLVACDGTEAIAAFDRHRPDLVLLDVKMPGIDGRAAAPATCRTWSRAWAAPSTTS
jgi:CheY-like chemotaxis protein